MRKSILAIAISAAAMAFAAQTAGATVIDLNFLNTEELTRKLVDSSNTNGTLDIKIDSDVRLLLSDLKKTSGLGYFDALSQVHDGKAVLVGTAGGLNYLDSSTHTILGYAKSAASGTMNEVISKLISQTESLTASETKTETGSTTILIGGKTDDGTTVNPLLIGVTGGDNVINAGYGYKFWIFTIAPFNTTVDLTRDGSTTISAESGNLFGVIGGSLGLNLTNIKLAQSGIETTASAIKTSTTITGDSTVTLDGTTSAAGVLAGSAALAIGGEAISIVQGGSNLTLSGDFSSSGFEGITIGAFGGGLAGATMNGTATTEVKGTTTVTIDSGLNTIVFGGGAALSAEFDGVWYKLPLGDYSSIISIADTSLLTLV